VVAVSLYKIFFVAFGIDSAPPECAEN